MSNDAQRKNDWDLLERCRKRNNDAWKELVDCHRQSLRLSIKSHMADEARDIQAVEDIEQQVWMALIEKDYKRLGLYDPERGCFDTFLKALALQVVQMRRRQNFRRKERECRLGDYEPRNPACNDGLVQAELAEFLQDLTRQESRCLRETLLRTVGEVSQPSISPGNVRYLIHRLQQKWRRHFDTP
jgi:hypothetical protein